MSTLSQLQIALNRYINEKIKISFIKRYAHIFILAYPISQALKGMIARYGFLYGLYNIMVYLDAFIYFTSLLGLLICFAKNNMKNIGIYFFLQVAINALPIIESGSIRGWYYYIGYCLLYGILAIMAFSCKGGDVPVQTPQTRPQNNKCRHCGNVVRSNASFCGACGEKID